MKIEVEVHFTGGDFYVYTFTSALLAQGFAGDVFKHGATFVRNAAYHKYSPQAVVKTVIKEIADEPIAKSPAPKRKAKSNSTRRQGSHGGDRKEDRQD